MFIYFGVKGIKFIGFFAGYKVEFLKQWRIEDTLASLSCKVRDCPRIV